MDIHNESNNEFISEEAWKMFVKWYGVNKLHHLDRKHLYFKDEKVFDVCILTPFSGITEHRVKKFNRFEEIGWVELQMRQMFQVLETKETRLWISEKGQMPKFRQLLTRSRMLNDCIVRDKTYILAIEELNENRWTTGEPGAPKGSLEKYSDLVQFKFPSTNAFESEINKLLKNLSAEMAESIRKSTEQVVKNSQQLMERKEVNLDEKLKKVLNKMEEYEQKLSEIKKQKVDIDEREQKLSKKLKELEQRESTIDFRENKFEKEKEEIINLNKILESKVKLEVGGQSFSTSLNTLTKEEDSLLATMFSGCHKLQPDQDGVYFIDRDGVHFRYILNYLRDSTIDLGTLPQDISVLRQILSEVKYYKLSNFADRLEKFINSFPHSAKS
ncbi:DgyrCDS12532 [Dimorphilus gyrociliatus]|nr:DgyrCDS12532 [Dimorphilus gyrociliatus]